jgi:hypothetical protein
VTPQQQIRAALKILKPSRRLRNSVMEEVKLSLAEIDAQARHAKPMSKQQRLVTARLLHALRRSAVLARGLSKDDPYWSLFPAIAPAAIAHCERVLCKLPAAKHRATDQQTLAVAHARFLISEFGDQKDLALTRGNGWHALAAILYGDGDIDLFRHMRSLKKRTRSVVSRRFRDDPGSK